ncbi:MAG: DUF4369 domain-containing protein [Bacteroidales bacterium]
MKHLATLLLILTLFACKKEAQKEFLIANISNLKETEVYLSIGVSNDSKIDTIKVQNGKFTVESAPDDAETMQLYLPKNNRMVLFFANADSRLKLSGNADDAANLVVVGDSVNNKYADYKRSIAAETKALEEAMQKAQNALQADSLKRYEELLYSPKMMQNRQQLRDKTGKFIAQNTSSYQALLAVRCYLQLTGDAAAIANWWTHLNGENMKEFSTFHEIKKIYKQTLPLKVGGTFASFQAYGINNNQEYFFSQMGKKSLILVWSSADKYSLYLNKKLSAATTQLAKDSLNYSAISLDDSFDNWKNATKDLKGKQLIVRGGWQNEEFKKTGVSRTPCIVAIDKKGKISKLYDLGENPLK